MINDLLKAASACIMLARSERLADRGVAGLSEYDAAVRDRIHELSNEVRNATDGEGKSLSDQFRKIVMSIPDTNNAPIDVSTVDELDRALVEIITLLRRARALVP